MSDETDLLPKWLSNQGIILAKDQFHHSYTFWAMPILIFSPVQIIMGHPLFGQDEGGGVQKLSIFVHAQNIKTVHTVLTTFPWKVYVYVYSAS